MSILVAYGQITQLQSSYDFLSSYYHTEELAQA